jgi:hypothetical protein
MQAEAWHKSIRTDGARCTFVQIDASSMDTTALTAAIVKASEPTLLTELPRSAGLRHSHIGFLEQWGDEHVARGNDGLYYFLGPGESSASLPRTKLLDIVDNRSVSVHVFENITGSADALRRLREAMPSRLQDAAEAGFGYTEQLARLEVAAQGSSFVWHSHGAALNMQISGRKRWLAFSMTPDLPMDLPPRRAGASVPRSARARNYSGVRNTLVRRYASGVSAQLTMSDWARDELTKSEVAQRGWECTQRAGEAVVMPALLVHRCDA